jgi:lipoprotein-anchoring transpeptidase ErfK/SrfK
MKAALAGGIVVVVLAAAPAALYAYDRSRADLVADGVRAGGVDIGGLTADRARAVLRSRLAAPLQRPLVLRAPGRDFVLTAEAAGVRVDVEGMVGAALNESRDGNFLTRTWRDLTGGALDERIPLRVRYSPALVGAMVERVGRALARPARNARATPSATAVQLIPSRRGLRVRARELRRRIVSTLVRPEAERMLDVRTRLVTPKVTTGELREKFSHFIGVSRGRFELRLFERLRLVKVYRISVGQIGYETPAGLYHIENKAVNPSWFVPNRPWAGALAGKVIPPGPANSIRARWLGIYDGAGIHGTAEVDSIGTRASRGCIRMLVPEVIELYDRVSLGTPVYIG